MQVLITGGCGFIGSTLADVLLGQGHDVVVVDNLSLGKDRWLEKEQTKRPKVVVADVTNREQMISVFAKEEPEVVFHLAAHHYIPFCENNPYEAYNLNVGGTLAVLDASAKAGVRSLFFASTGDVYCPNNIPHNENETPSPIYLYGHTKRVGEEICLKYFQKVKSIPNIVVGRIFNATGPGETNPHLIPEVVKQIAAGKQTVEVGNLWPLRDYVDVRSMAEIIGELGLNAKNFDLINIGSGTVQTVGDALAKISEVAANKIDFVSVASRQRPNDRAFLCPDTSRLVGKIGRSALPFSAETARRILEEAGIACRK